MDLPDWFCVGEFFFWIFNVDSLEGELNIWLLHVCLFTCVYNFFFLVNLFNRNGWRRGDPPASEEKTSVTLWCKPFLSLFQCDLLLLVYVLFSQLLVSFARAFALWISIWVYIFIWNFSGDDSNFLLIARSTVRSEGYGLDFEMDVLMHLGTTIPVPK